MLVERFVALNIKRKQGEEEAAAAAGGLKRPGPKRGFRQLGAEVAKLIGRVGARRAGALHAVGCKLRSLLQRWPCSAGIGGARARR